MWLSAARRACNLAKAAPSAAIAAGCVARRTMLTLSTSSAVLRTRIVPVLQSQQQQPLPSVCAEQQLISSTMMVMQRRNVLSRSFGPNKKLSSVRKHRLKMKRISMRTGKTGGRPRKKKPPFHRPYYFSFKQDNMNPKFRESKEMQKKEGRKY